MPTTFNVFFLGSTGNFWLDSTEGNSTVENAASLQGASVGSATNPLFSRIVQFSPGSTGFGNGNSTAYDTDNNAVGGGETFRINGGADQTFDASVVYNSTITYTDGTTASISVVVFKPPTETYTLRRSLRPTPIRPRLRQNPFSRSVWAI